MVEDQKLSALDPVSLPLVATDKIYVVRDGVSYRTTVGDLPATEGPAGSTDYTELTNKPTLGGAAAKNVGTGAGDVAAGNHTHTMDAVTGLEDALHNLSGGTQSRTFSISGQLATFTGALRWYAPQNITLIDAMAAVADAPVGAAITCDVRLNGSTTLCSPSIADGANTGAAAAITQEMAATDYLTVNLTQVGSTTPGANLTVRIRYENN